MLEGAMKETYEKCHSKLRTIFYSVRGSDRYHEMVFERKSLVNGRTTLGLQNSVLIKTGVNAPSNGILKAEVESKKKLNGNHKSERLHVNLDKIKLNYNILGEKKYNSLPCSSYLWNS